MSERLRAALAMAAVFVACAAGFHALLAQLGPYVADVDGLYHYRVSELILHHGPWVDITWLPYTVLGERGPDHHWLFHLLVAPLTALGHDQRSLMLAAALVGAAMPVAVWPILKRAGVPFALGFALAMMFASDSLPLRFLGLRTQSLAIVFMVAALFAMAWGRAAWVGVISFLFTESYHGAVILGLFLVATLAAEWILERRVTFKLVTATAIGVFAGLLLSPWFPRNVSYLIFHTVFKTGVSNAFLVGAEWLPPAASFLLEGDAVAHGMLALGLAALVVTRPSGAWPRIGRDTLAACMVSAVFLAMNAQSWRFTEYYAPFAVVTSGLLLRDAARQYDGHVARVRAVAIAAIVAALAWGIPRAVGIMTPGPGKFERYDLFASFMRYIDTHDAHPMVVDTRWSDFQHMVYWSDRARYAAGLDGNYLRFGDPQRYATWYAFSTGAWLDRKDNARRLGDAFGAGWIVVHSSQPALAQNLRADPDAELVMTDRDGGWLFRLRPGA
jgi:hypothetical protein